MKYKTLEEYQDNGIMYPLGQMKQYPIERDTFCEIFKGVFNQWNEIGIHEPINTYEFFLFYDCYNETAYMLHKDSGIVITWYKFNHLGRALECNKDLELTDYFTFAGLLENDLNCIERR